MGWVDGTDLVSFIQGDDATSNHFLLEEKTEADIEKRTSSLGRDTRTRKIDDGQVTGLHGIS